VERTWKGARTWKIPNSDPPNLVAEVEVVVTDEEKRRRARARAFAIGLPMPK